MRGGPKVERFETNLVHESSIMRQFLLAYIQNCEFPPDNDIYSKKALLKELSHKWSDSNHFPQGSSLGQKSTYH